MIGRQTDATFEGWARYAIYAVPPAESALFALGSEWLLGPDRPAFAALGLSDAQIQPLVRTPARYGFHGTLKSPFRLAEGATVEALDMAIAAFAAARSPVAAPQLRITTDNGFVALRCGGPSPELNARAFEIVQAFDGFRAPLSDEDRARRKPETLDERGRELLELWGYPWVQERFHFHFTLSSWTPQQEAERLAAQLAPIFAPTLTDPFLLEEIALFGIRKEGAAFKILSRHRFSGA
ncbi:MAG: DUF1045 domain-containing protein [Neomegalonema sp.]|nr:DUF1045 domain-containing protein [Neomegalonema sp.]